MLPAFYRRAMAIAVTAQKNKKQMAVRVRKEPVAIVDWMRKSKAYSMAVQNWSKGGRMMTYVTACIKAGIDHITVAKYKEMAKACEAIRESNK